jgi:hypothetical protein
VQQLARRFRGRVFSGLMALLFLLPVPAWAALTFNWTSPPSSDSPLVSVSLGGSNQSILNFVFNGPAPSGSQINLFGVANVTGTDATKSITADFSNWKGPITLGTNGQMDISITYGNQPTPPFIVDQTFTAGQTPGSASNQFSVTPQREQTSATQLIFSITINGPCSVSSTAHTASIAFVEQ